MNNQPTIIYDGVCNLCAGTVAFIRKRAKHGAFQFIPAQNQQAIAAISPELNTLASNLQTVIFYKDGQIFIKSEAILEIMKLLGGGWPILAKLQFLPIKFRDSMYEMIALNRYRWFGKRESCRLD